MPKVEATNYVAWFNIGKNGINHNDPATANLQQITVGSAGFIKKAPQGVDHLHAAADRDRARRRDPGR